MFNINFNKLIVLILIPVARKSYLVNLLKALVKPIILLYNDFYAFRLDMLDKVSITSQVYSIRKALNDNFDIAERRIIIKNAGGEDVLLIDSDTDYIEYEAIIGTDTDLPLNISNDSAYDASEYEVVIVTPYQFSNSTLIRLRALVDANILFGIRYDIISAI